MSYKIKTLSSRQVAELMEVHDNPLSHSEIRLYLTTVLPGLFYSVSDKLRNIQDEKFLYVPPDILNTGYSPGIFDSIVLKNFAVADQPIPIEGMLFFPIMVENISVGGLLCESSRSSDQDRRRLLEHFSVSEYFNLIFNINDRLAGGEAIAVQLLDLMARQKSYDSFLRSVPDWLVGFLGGGLVSVYYRSGDEFLLRKMAGHLSLFEEMPTVMPTDESRVLLEALSDHRLFLPVGEVPEYATELLVPPQIRFVLGGRMGADFQYLLTGIMPNITAYSFALLLDRLGQILQGITEDHFSRQPDWHRLFLSLDELIGGGRSPQELAEQIISFLGDYLNINRVSVARYHQLENLVEIEGAADSRGKAGAMTKMIFPCTGTPFETVIETGHHVFKNDIPIKVSGRIEHELYREGVRSYLMMPIGDDKELLAILTVGSPMRGDYLKRHLPVFETLAAYLARVFAIVAKRQIIDLYSDELEKISGQLMALENLKTMGELSSGVFHDLNNVIGGIVGRCEIMMTRLEKLPADEISAKLINDVKLILQSAQDSGEILKRLRQLSKKEPEQPMIPVNIAQIVTDAIEMVRPRWQRLMQDKEIKIVLKKELSDGLMAHGNPSRLREVFTNLLLNALDALPGGGEISINGLREGASGRITVSDTGLGIPSDIIDKIFEPFFTTKGASGTGLGLPICRKIIENHGGKLSVDSRPGVGTRFLIELPLQEGPTPVTGTTGKPGTGNSISVLMIESGFGAFESISRLLTGEGYRLSRAGDGREAINQCGKERYDILIIDFSLSDMRGLDLAVQIRAFDKTVRIILAGSQEADLSVSELMKKGIDGFLTIPVDESSFHDTLNNLLAEQPHGS